MNRRYDIELTRIPGDRRCYALDDVGTLRLEGLLMRTATATAGAETWRFARRGFWQRAIEASDAAGETVGAFAPRDIRRGGRLRWRKTDYTLRPHSSWRERYVLGHGNRELALVEASGWWGWGARRPVRMNVDDLAATDPGLLLFTAFVVRALADAASTNAGTAATVTTTTSSGG
jgi:hypothetical protein